MYISYNIINIYFRGVTTAKEMSLVSSPKNCCSGLHASDIMRACTNGSRVQTHKRTPTQPSPASYKLFIVNMLGKVTLLWPNDAIWRHKTGSTLAQIIACCLMTPSHYLNQCWLIISKVQWQSPGPRLNIKTVLSTYDDFHDKDKTAVRTSYL